MTQAFIKGKDTLTVTYGGQIYTIPLGAQADEAMTAIKEDRWQDIPDILDKSKAVSSYSEGKIVVRNGVVFIGEDELPHTLSNRIIEFMEEDAPYQPLIRFWERLQKNPSYRAVNELYGFLEAANIPILDDGRVLTYKVVRKLDQPIYRNAGTYRYGNVTVVTKGGYAPYVDIHTRQVVQQIGDVVSMARRNVDEDSNKTCSKGLHLCSWSYTSCFGNVKSGSDVVLELAADPADFVAIPSDYNNAKARVSSYQILGINENLTERRTSYVSDYPEYIETYDDDDLDFFDEEDTSDYLYDDDYSVF